MSDGILQPDDLSTEELTRLQAELGGPADPGTYGERYQQWMARAAEADPERRARIEQYLRDNFAPPDEPAVGTASDAPDGGGAPDAPDDGGAVPPAPPGGAAPLPPPPLATTNAPPLPPPPIATAGWSPGTTVPAGDGGAAAVGALAARGAASRPPRSPAASVIAALLVAFVAVTAIIGAAKSSPTAGTAAPRVNLSGDCSGTGTALDHSGATIDKATAPSPAASPTHPFIVRYNGTVPYTGQSKTPITNHKWEVSVFDVEVRSGGSANHGDLTISTGTEKVNKYLPIKLTGLFYVSGSIKGQGGDCAGNVWVLLAGSPVGTVLWIAGLVLMVIGALLLLFRRPSFRPPGAPRRYRRRPVTGLLGGLIGGAGFTLFLISYGKVPYGLATPIVIPAALAVLGLAWGIAGPRRGRRTALILSR
jgi:hypothetical protein